jgi:hypothetical protein
MEAEITRTLPPFGVAGCSLVISTVASHIAMICAARWGGLGRCCTLPVCLGQKWLQALGQQ